MRQVNSVLSTEDLSRYNDWSMFNDGSLMSSPADVQQTDCAFIMLHILTVHVLRQLFVVFLLCMKLEVHNVTFV